MLIRLFSALFLISSMLVCKLATAGVILSVVLDPSYAPSSGTAVPTSARMISVLPGATVNARIFAELTAGTSLSNYQFAISYNPAQVSYVAGSRTETPTNLPGLTELNTAGNTVNTTTGRVFGLDGGTFGNGPVAPLGPVQVAALSFLSTNQSSTITPGIFQIGADGFFDNAGIDLVAGSQVTFQSGTITAVPEPSSIMLFGAAGLGMCLTRRRSKTS
jgi:hypothetical protein